MVRLRGLIQSHRPVFCISARDVELEEEVWTRGVDRFSQRVRKFESRSLLLQTSALSWNFLASRAEERLLPCCQHTSNVFFLTKPTWAAKFEQKPIKQGGEWPSESSLCFSLSEVLETPLVSVGDSSRSTALCPFTDTNTNIIPTRGGNSFLTWMIKIFLKSMIMTSCGMGSKHNYCCCCKCFLLLYFCCTIRNWIVFWMEEAVDSL